MLDFDLTWILFSTYLAALMRPALTRNALLHQSLGTCDPLAHVVLPTRTTRRQHLLGHSLHRKTTLLGHSLQQSEANCTRSQCNDAKTFEDANVSALSKRVELRIATAQDL